LIAALLTFIACPGAVFYRFFSLKEMQNRFGSVTHQTARATFRDDQIGNDLTPRSETRARGAHEHRSRTRIVPFARARATNERRAADGRRRTPRALGSVVIEFSL
jgi:hypothetical protein